MRYIYPVSYCTCMWCAVYRSWPILLYMAVYGSWPILLLPGRRDCAYIPPVGPKCRKDSKIVVYGQQSYIITVFYIYCKRISSTLTWRCLRAIGGKWYFGTCIVFFGVSNVHCPMSIGDLSNVNCPLANVNWNWKKIQEIENIDSPDELDN